MKALCLFHGDSDVGMDDTGFVIDITELSGGVIEEDSEVREKARNLIAQLAEVCYGELPSNVSFDDECPECGEVHLSHPICPMMEEISSQI